MKTLIIVLLVVQGILLLLGILLLCMGQIGSGIFNIVINLAFGALNVFNYKQRLLIEAMEKENKRMEEEINGIKAKRYKMIEEN